MTAFNVTSRIVELEAELASLRLNDPYHRGLCDEFEELLPPHPRAAQGVTGLWLERLKTMRAFVERVAKQRPEKPDHWCSCGQCERNAEEARELTDRA